MGVVAVGQGQVQHVGIEIVIAAAAAMLRVNHVQVAGPPAERIAQVVQGPIRRAQPISAAAALGTDAAGIVPRAFDDPNRGQVLDAGNAFRGFGPVKSRSGHVSLRAVPGDSTAQEPSMPPTLSVMML